MQVNSSTGEVYAMSKAKAAGEELELTTVAPMTYSVLCWNTKEDECRWCKDFGGDLAAAVAEYNKWAAVPEKVPSFN